MTIWFAGILQNTCCNNGKKNKTKIKLRVVSVVYFNYIKCRISVFAMKTHTKKTQKLTHLLSGASEINKFIFFGLLRHFFLGWMDTHFLGTPFQDRTWLFSTFAYCILDAFLKKRMALRIWKSDVKCWRKGRNFNIKVNVIELYVIKSWWKIKFSKRKVYHQLVFLCVFFSFVN